MGTKHIKDLKQYALFRGDQHICTGTVPEIAHTRGIRDKTVWHYATPAYKKLLEKSKNPENRFIVIPLEDTEEISKRMTHSP